LRERRAGGGRKSHFVDLVCCKNQHFQGGEVGAGLSIKPPTRC
jgi:hypothetical protein